MDAWLVALMALLKPRERRVMIETSCSLHAELEVSLRNDGLSDELKIHIRECETCYATALADRMLRRLDDGFVVPSRLRNAEALWWRSRVLLRLTENSRRQDRRPMRLMALLASVLPLILVLSAASWVWLDRVGDINPFLLSLLVMGAMLVLTPVLGWLTLWLADEVLSPV